MKIPKPILERRHSIRIEESLPFKIGHHGYDIQATTLNISSRGVMCLVDRDIPLMTQLEIGLSIPGISTKGSKPRQLLTKGVVVRKEKDPRTGKFLIGIYFSDLKEKQLELLLKFIEHRLKKDTLR